MARKNRYKPRKDGRYYTLVGTGEYDEYGRPIRIPLYGDSSKDLEEKVDALKAQIKTGKYVVKKNTTFEDYANTFVSLYKSKREYNTQRMYKTILDTYLIPEFGNWLLSDIKRTDIQALINATKFFVILYLSVISIQLLLLKYNCLQTNHVKLLSVNQKIYSIYFPTNL